jgi:hypothetical protein
MGYHEIGNYHIHVTRRGLSLMTKPGVEPVHRVELPAAQAIELLQALYFHRDFLLLGAQPDLAYGARCPTCKTRVKLEKYPDGWYGACNECGNDFTLDFAGRLIQHGYER